MAFASPLRLRPFCLFGFGCQRCRRSAGEQVDRQTAGDRLIAGETADTMRRTWWPAPMPVDLADQCARAARRPCPGPDVRGSRRCAFDRRQALDARGLKPCQVLSAGLADRHAATGCPRMNDLDLARPQTPRRPRRDHLRRPCPALPPIGKPRQPSPGRSATTINARRVLHVATASRRSTTTPDARRAGRHSAPAIWRSTWPARPRWRFGIPKTDERPAPA